MTVPSGNALPPLAIDPFALTESANHFLEGVELLGYSCPRVSYCLEDISRGLNPVCRFAPDDRNRDPDYNFTLLRALRNLESQFNPDHLRQRDPRRIQRIAQWAEAEEEFQLCQKTSMGALTGTKWRKAVGLAMAVETIWDWWHLNDDPDRDSSLSNSPLIQLPRGVIGAMKKATANLVWAGEDDACPIQPPRQHNPRQAPEAHTAAKFVVLTCNSITSVVHCTPRVGGPLLLSLLDDLQEAADLIPAEGWEPCIGGGPIEFAGTVAATAHQATLQLAQRFSSLPWSPARQAKFNRWGKIAADWFIPALFAWDDAALPTLAQKLSGHPPIPVQRWLAQLEVEAARLRPATHASTGGESAVTRGRDRNPADDVQTGASEDTAETKPVVTSTARERLVGKYIRTHKSDRRKPTVRSVAKALSLSTKAVCSTNAWRKYAEKKRAKAKKRPIPLSPRILAVVKDHASGSVLETKVSREVEKLVAEQEKEHRADQRRPRKRS